MEFIPPRIKYLKQKGLVKSCGTLVYADIMGFTKLSEMLRAHGFAGTEELSSILNKFYTEIFDLVSQQGGEPLKIIGDAFIVAYYEKKVHEVKGFIEGIIEYSKKFHGLKTLAGPVDLKVKIVGASGCWLEFLVGCENKADLFLSGPLVKYLSTLKEQIESEFHMEETNFDVQSYDYNPDIFRFSDEAFSDPDVEELYAMNVKGEQRVVIPMFVQIGGYDESHPDIPVICRLVKELNDIVTQFHGKMQVIDNFLPYGARVLFLFGAPKAQKNDPLNAARALKEISQKYSKEYEIKAAANLGYSFAGLITTHIFTFYTAFGDTINTAARLASSIDWGEFCVTNEIYKSLKDNFQFYERPPIYVKGKEKPITRYFLISQAETVKDKKIFVGREYFLSRLKKELLESDSIIVVEGEGGVGKTSLVREFLEQLHDYKVLNLKFDSTRPKLFAFSELIATEAGISGGDDPDQVREKLHEFLKSLDHFDGELIQREEFLGIYLFNLNYPDSVYTEISPKLRWQNLVDALKLVLRGLSVENPIVVWIDDFHDASDMEFSLLSYLIRALYWDERAKTKIKFIICRRPAGKDIAFLEDVQYVTIKLPPLSKEETTTLIKSILQVELSPEAIELIFEKSEGNPFFLEQYLNLLKERNAIREKSGKFEIIPEAITEIPESMFSVIMERVDLLEERVKEKLRIGSVIGIKFQKTPIFCITKDKYLERDLTTAVKEKIILPEPGELEEIEYIFSHAYHREVIYQSILTSRRKTLHREIARVYEETYEDKKEMLYDIIAYHYDQAEDYEKALDYYLKSAKREKETFDNLRAEKQFKRAEEIILNFLQAERAKLIDIYVELSEIFDLRGETRSTLEYLEKAKHIAKEYNLKDMEISCKLKILDKKVMTEDHRTAMAELKDIIKELELGPYEDTLVGEANNIMSKSYRVIGEFEKAISHSNRAVEILHQSKDFIKLALALKNRGLIYLDRGDITRAMADYQEAFRIFEEHGFLAGIAGMYNNLGTLLYSQNKLDEALKYFEKAANVWKRMGDKENSGGILLNIAGVHYLRGDAEIAESLYKKALSIFKEIGSYFGIAVATINLGNLKTFSGHLADAISLYEESLKYRRKIMHITGIMTTKLCTIELLAFLNLTERALQHYAEVREIAMHGNVPEFLAILHFATTLLILEGILQADATDEDFDKIENLLKGNYKALFLISSAFRNIRKNDLQKADNTLKIAEFIRELKPETAFYLNYTKGLILLEKGFKAEAEQLFENLLKENLAKPYKAKLALKIWEINPVPENENRAKKTLSEIIDNLPEDIRENFLRKPEITKLFGNF